MGKGVSHPPGVHMSIRQLAEETGFDRDTVAKRLRNAGLNPNGKRGGHGVYRLRDALPALYVNNEDGEIDPMKLEPFQRKAHYQAAREAQKLATERRELIPRAEVEEEQARVAKIVVQALETLPDILERDCGMTREQLVKVETAIDRAREEMYEAVADNDQVEAPPVLEVVPAPPMLDMDDDISTVR